VGILVSEGMSLRIPVGALVLPLDGSPPPPVRVEVSLDMTPMWVDVALDQALVARRSREQLLRLVGTKDEAVHDALRAECTAAMLSLAGSAFALDALYESLLERAVLPPGTRERWAEKGTKRSRRIGETVRLALKPRLTNAESKEAAKNLSKLFQFRDWAVHPPADFREPLMHPVLNSGVEWRYVAYTFDNCRNALSFMLAYLQRGLQESRTRDRDLAEWAASMETRLEGRRTRFVSQFAGESSAAAESAEPAPPQHQTAD
jgi:hypothetical protein